MLFKVSDYNIVNPEYTVPNLKEFHDYEFRIVAENKVGRGIPSLPTAPIKIQASIVHDFIKHMA